VASYAIQVTLDVEAKTLTGHETITYVNRTEEPIPDLVFHLYLNAFRAADTLFLQEGGASHRGNRWDPQHPGWIRVTHIQLDGGPSLVLQEIADGTLARAELPEPVPPGNQVTVQLDFEALLPRVFARTGYVGDFFMVGQWFPKLGVWEEGAWNAYPFHANAEFYADFGHYDVQITLPERYITGGTGLPLSASRHEDGTKTIHYHAEDVIDFAWTACPRFEEAVRQVSSSAVHYLYLPEHAWTVQRVMDAAEAAIQAYGRWYGPYPYQRLTIVDVPDEGLGAGGMEYPMFVTAGPIDTLGLGPVLTRTRADRSLEIVVMHEIGHQWWQSVVAFNEAEEPWLDEGLTEYSTLRVLEETYGPDSSALDAGRVEVGYLDMQRLAYATSPRVPMYGPAWEFGPAEYGIAVYTKPALSLYTLERTLGEPTMLDILGTFYQRYRFGHPSTEDFRAVAEEIADQNLDWFFNGLVYGDGVVNYAVGDLGPHMVTVWRQGELAIPTEVLITFADGSTTIETWDGTQQQVTFTYPARPTVQSAEVDPAHRIAVDLRWADNGLSHPRQSSAWMAILARLVHAVQSALLLSGGL
jgi:hypothetical protein